MEHDRFSGRALEGDSCRRLNEHVGRFYINKLLSCDKWKSKTVQCIQVLLERFDASVFKQAELFEGHNENSYEILQHTVRNNIYSHTIYVANKTKVKAIMR